MNNLGPSPGFHYIRSRLYMYLWLSVCFALCLSDHMCVWLSVWMTNYRTDWEYSCVTTVHMSAWLSLGPIACHCNYLPVMGELESMLILSYHCYTISMNNSWRTYQAVLLRFMVKSILYTIILAYIIADDTCVIYLRTISSRNGSLHHWFFFQRACRI